MRKQTRTHHHHTRAQAVSCWLTGNDVSISMAQTWKFDKLSLWKMDHIRIPHWTHTCLFVLFEFCIGFCLFWNVPSLPSVFNATVTGQIHSPFRQTLQLTNRHSEWVLLLLREPADYGRRSFNWLINQECYCILPYRHKCTRVPPCPFAMIVRLNCYYCGLCATVGVWVVGFFFSTLSYTHPDRWRQLGLFDKHLGTIRSIEAPLLAFLCRQWG